MPPKSTKDKETDQSAQAAANVAAANAAASAAARNANAIAGEMDRRMKKFEEQNKLFVEAQKKQAEERENSFLAIINSQQALLEELKTKNASNLAQPAQPAPLAVATATMVGFGEDHASLEAGPTGSGLTAELNPLGHYLSAPSRGCSNGDIGKFK